MIFFYLIIAFLLSVNSYALIDPNLTLIQSSWWVLFRDRMVELGYYHRDVSWMLYLVIIILLFIFHHFFLKNYKQFSPIKLAIIIGLIFLFSYPFLSHDFFNYMFDAKIATFYYKNPYFYKALDFPHDQWLRFMHWTHRTYPYGPTFILITLVPSFLSFGKFVMSFILFKATFIIFYVLAVFILKKMNKRWAIIFATSPLIIVEGMINNHNDLIGVCLAITGIYFLFKKKSLKASLFFLLSIGIKFITVPLLFALRSYTKWYLSALLLLCGILIYLSFKSEIQPWYFLNLFIFLPFYERFINRLNIFFLGLLLSYYPYIRLGAWDSPDKINLKHTIIIFFGLVNIIYILLIKLNDRRANR